jgi:hypothetical protein
MRRPFVVLVLSLLALGLMLGPALSRGLRDTPDAPAPIELRPDARTEERPQRAAAATKPRRQAQKPTGKVRPQAPPPRPAALVTRPSPPPPPAPLQPPVRSDDDDDDDDNDEGDDDDGSEDSVDDD